MCVCDRSVMVHHLLSVIECTEFSVVSKQNCGGRKLFQDKEQRLLFIHPQVYPNGFSLREGLTRIETY